MKKVLFAAAAIGFLALGSCKKDYTCKCTQTFPDGSTNTTTTTITDHKSDAEATCKDNNGSFGSYSQSCELD